MLCAFCNRDLLEKKFKLVYNRTKTKFWRVKKCNQCRHKDEFGKYRLQRKLWRDKPENKFKAKNYIKLWRQNNINKVRILSLRSRIKRENLLFQVKEDFTEQDFILMQNLFNNMCFKCKCKENLQLDHHYPLSKGYKLSKDNAVILCQSCNSKKGTKMPESFYSDSELNQLNFIFSLALTS